MDPLLSVLIALGPHGLWAVVVIRLAWECRAQMLERIKDKEADRDRMCAQKDDYRKTAIEVTQAFERTSTAQEAIARAVDRNTEAVRAERRTRSDDAIAAQRQPPRPIRREEG